MARWEDEDLDLYDRIRESVGDVQAELRRLIGVHFAELDEERLTAIRQCLEIARKREAACDHAAATTADSLDKQVWRERAFVGECIARDIMAAFPEAFQKKLTTNE